MGSKCSSVEKVPERRVIKHKGKPVPVGLTTIPKLNKGKFGVQYQNGRILAPKVIEVKNKVTAKVAVEYKLQKSAFPCGDAGVICERLQALEGFHHLNVCQMNEVFDDIGCIHIIYNYVHGVPLLDHIATMRHMSERKASDIGRQLVRALACGEKVGIVHGALVPKNIFVDKSGQEIYITDFGLVDYVKPDTVHRMDMDSLAFTAPEILKPWYDKAVEAEGVASKKKAVNWAHLAGALPPVSKTTSTDLYSVGCILYLLMTGQVPFKGKQHTEVARKILEEHVDMLRMSKKVSDEAKDLVIRLLSKDSHVRPASAEKLLSSNWLAKPEQTISDEELDFDIFKELGTLQKETRFKKFVMKMVSHNLPYHKVQGLKDAFHLADQDGNGFITLAELHHFVKTHPDVAASWSHDVDSVFNEVDVDGEGQISLPEFIAATLDSQEVLVRTTLWDAFRAIDADRNGKLTSAELKKVINGVSGSLGKDHVNSLTQILDLEVGGKEITFEEFLSLISEEGGREQPSSSALCC